MDSIRRARLLRGLELEVWTRKGASRSVSAEPVHSELSSPPATSTEAVVATSATPRSPQKPAFADEAKTAMHPPAYTAPSNWTELAAAVASCERCKLCKTRTNTVFGVGPQDAPLLIVGEGPGADEDAQGAPFVGRAGKLLDEMLKSIGRSRATNTYIANVVKCRPPGNRDPEADEVAACRPYLDRQIELIKPTLIVALGRIAAQRLLDTDAPLSKLRGPVYEYGDAKTPVMITYHPAYLLRSPGEKAKSWVDLKRVHRFLSGIREP